MYESDEITEISVVDMIWAWDGRVLEIFGRIGHDGLRFHKDRFKYQVSGPDRKDRYQIDLGDPNRMTVKLESQDFPAVEAFLSKVKPPQV